MYIINDDEDTLILMTFELKTNNVPVEFVDLPQQLLRKLLSCAI
jgi:hypothetical protein